MPGVWGPARIQKWGGGGKVIMSPGGAYPLTQNYYLRNFILKYQVRKKQPKHKVSGRDIPGTSGTQTSGYPGQKLYASGLFLLF